MLENNEKTNTPMIDDNPMVADIFACVLQHGSKDSEIVFQFHVLDAEALFEGQWLNLYRIIVEYFRLTGNIIGEDEFNKSIEDSQFSEEDRGKYMQLFAELSGKKINREAFNFYIERLKNKVIANKGYVMLVNAHQVLSRELIVGKRSYSGYSGMQQYVTETMYDIDRLKTERTPEGDVNEELDEIIDEYNNMKERDDFILTGFSAVDKCTGGLFPGELWLWVGYTGEGKTFSCINIGHNAAYVHGKNVLYLTSETVREVVRRRLISRHARHLFDCGIDLTAWKTGKLTDECLKIIQNTINDTKKKKNEYGTFYIIQMPANANTDYVSATLTRYQSLFNFDLCILDSIHLLIPKKHRQSEYSELGDMLIEIKKIIVAHNNGRGVPLISPWHTNRASWDNAKQCGYYTKSSLAKTGEAERSADVIVTILCQDSDEKKLKGSIIKNRDGEELKDFYLNVDFSQGYVGDCEVGNFINFDFDELLNVE